MNVLSFVNQKGGCAKTASAAALIAGLRIDGRRVLAIDIDPQGDLTAQMNATSQPGKNLFDVVTGKARIDQAIQETSQGPLIASDSRLASKGLLSDNYGAFALVKPLEALSKRFDVIVIDTPPNIGTLSVTAMTASNSIIIPAVPDRHSIDAIRQTAASIEAIRKSTNKGLKIMGVLPTMFQSRFTVHRVQMRQLSQIAAAMGVHVFAPVRYCAVVQEAEFMNHSVFEARKGNPAALDYRAFVDDVEKRL